jgi:hypothetical protein
VLSREIAKLVSERGKVAVARIIQKWKTDTVGLLVALSTGEREAGASKRKHRAVSHDATVKKVSPLSSETHNGADDNSTAPAFPRPYFLAPYLKGKPTQFEGKVKAWITTLLVLRNAPSPVPVPKNTVVVQTRRTNPQKNAQWCNERSYGEDMRERKKAATKEATKTFANLAAGKIKNPKTQLE